jgi:hypothetical protein
MGLRQHSTGTVLLSPMLASRHWLEEQIMNNIIYIVGLVVVVMAVLAFFGLR